MDSANCETLSKDQILKLRQKHIPNLSIHYSSFNPLNIVRGEGVYFYDENGQAYIDCINNVAQVGHSNPRVVSAFSRQLAQAQYEVNPITGRLVATQQQVEQYTSRLLATFPGSGLDCVLFAHSGTEANDLAISLCEAATGNTETIAIDGAYHGHSKPLSGLSTYKSRQEKIPGSFKPNPNAMIAPLPDAFRGIYCDPETAGQQYADEVKKMIDKAHSNGKRIACFMCEAMLGCAGQVDLPKDYLKATFKHVRDAGGLCVIDEIQTGFGRAGESFWIHQKHGVHPDIVTLGKPMANGYPVSAVVTRKSIVAKYAQCHGEQVLAEFMAEPLGIAVADAVLSVIMDQQLQLNAKLVGDYIMSELENMKKTHPNIGDIRGYGLFIGLEIVTGRENPQADSVTAKELVKRVLLQHRIMLREDGVDNNVIKIKPPIIFTKEQATLLLTAIDSILTDIESSQDQNGLLH